MIYLYVDYDYRTCRYDANHGRLGDKHGIVRGKIIADRPLIHGENCHWQPIIIQDNDAQYPKIMVGIDLQAIEDYQAQQHAPEDNKLKDILDERRENKDKEKTTRKRRKGRADMYGHTDDANSMLTPTMNYSICTNNTTQSIFRNNQATDSISDIGGAQCNTTNNLNSNN
jgi:hypothetical protein